MNLSKDAIVVSRLINVTGCMSISQVATIFPKKSDKAIRYILSQLYHQNYISFLENNYIVPYKKDIISRESVLCVWAMLDDESEAGIGIDISNPMELEMIASTEFPRQFMYVHNNILYDVIYIHDGNIANLLYMEKDYKNKMDDDLMMNYCILIVIEDESIIEKIAAINLPVSSVIAVVHTAENLFLKPEIEFYK